ncbi:unnamed protein product, partial [Ranitomeya imitator]
VSLCLRHIFSFSRTSLFLRSVSYNPDTRQALLELGFSEEQAEKDPEYEMPSTQDTKHQGAMSHWTESQDSTENARRKSRASKDYRPSFERQSRRTEGPWPGRRFYAELSVEMPGSFVFVPLPSNGCNTVSQEPVLNILNSTPEILTQDPSHMEDLFQYVYFRMGGNHREIISAQVFQTSLDEIRVRHQFLERLGRFQPPNKKRECPPSNPKLKEVIQLSEEDFISKTARSSVEEFNTFCKILEREEQEGEQDEEDIEDEPSNDEDDDETNSDSEDDSEDEDYKENVHNEKPKYHHKKKFK